MTVDNTLFGSSQVRRQILQTFFARPQVERHVRELARELDWSPTIVGRELGKLEGAGILRSERIGTARRYSVDHASPIASEIRAIVQKTIGIEARLKEAIAGLVGVEEAFLYGSYAAGTDRSSSDLDLFVVGTVDQAELGDRLSDVERDLGRDVNLATYERHELERLRRENDLFVRRVFDSPRVPLLGAG